MSHYEGYYNIILPGGKKAKRFFVVKDKSLFWYKDEKEYKKGEAAAGVVSIHPPTFFSLEKKEIKVTSPDKNFSISEHDAPLQPFFKVLSNVPTTTIPVQQVISAPVTTNAFQLTLAAENLPKMDSGFFASCDPFFEIHCGGLLYRSEVIKKTLSPTWKEFEFTIPPLVFGYTKEIFVKLYDWDEDGSHDHISDIQIPFAELKSGASFPVSSTAKNKGVLKIISCKPSVKPEHIPTGGWKITISGRKLIAMDANGKADPFFKFSILRNKRFNDEFVIYHKSEIKDANLNPDWNPFVIDNRDAKPDDAIQITFFDYDNDGKQEIMGTWTGKFLDLLVSNSGFPFVIPKSKKNAGLFVVTCSFCGPKEDYWFNPPKYWKISCEAKKLAMEGFKKKPDPFFLLSTDSATIFRSDVNKDTQSPKWKDAIIGMDSFTLALTPAAKIDEPIFIDVYDWDPDGGHDIIGQIETSIRELLLPTKRWPISTGGEFIVTEIVPVDAAPTVNVAPAYEIKCSGMKLSKTDIGASKADPYFTVRSPTKLLLWRSQIIKNNSSPKFEPFIINTASVGFYSPFRITVYDWDSNSTHDEIGHCDTSLYELTLGSFQYPLYRKNISENSGQNGPGRIMYGKSKSYGAFSVDAISPCSPTPFATDPLAVELSLSVENLRKMDTGPGQSGKADPYLKIFVRNHLIYKSEIKYKTLSAEFQKFQLNLLELSYYYHKSTPTGSKSKTAPPPLTHIPMLDIPFQIQVVDFDDNSDDDLIGHLDITVRELLFIPFNFGLTGKNNPGSLTIRSIVPVPPVKQNKWYPLPASLSIKLKAQKLKKMDSGPGGAADPFFKVVAFDPYLGTARLLYRSEVIKQNLNPDWQAFVIPMDLIYSSSDKITISVFDWDQDGTHDLIGHVQFSLDNLNFSWLYEKITNKDKCNGCLIFENVTPLDAWNAPAIPVGVTLNCSADRLAKMDGPLSKTDAFFTVTTEREIWRQGSLQKENIIVYRSEVIRQNLKPKWKEFDLTVEDIGGMDREFTITVYDWDPNGGTDSLGCLPATLRELTFGPLQRAIRIPGHSSSRGAFSFDSISPITVAKKLIVFPAYVVKPAAKNLAKMDVGLTSKSDPFFEVYYTPQTPEAVATQEEVVKYYRDMEQRKLQYDKIQYTQTMARRLSQIKHEIEFSIFNNTYIPKNSTTTPTVTTTTTTISPNSPNTATTITTSTLTQPFDFELDMAERQSQYLPLKLHDKNLIPEKPIFPGYVPPPPDTHFWIPPIHAPYVPSEVKKYMQYLQSLQQQYIQSLQEQSFLVPPTFVPPPLPINSQFPPPYSMQTLLYRSEVIRQNLNPTWNEFVIDTALIGGIDVPLTFIVYDWDTNGTHDEIGTFTTTVREFLLPGFVGSLQEEGRGKSRGAYVIEWVNGLPQAPPELILPDALEVCCSAMKLKAMDGIGRKSDPFFEVHFKGRVLYRSEVVVQNLEPSWAPFVLNVSDVKGLDQEFIIMVRDWDSNGSHDNIGRLSTTLRKWMFGSYQQAIKTNSGSDSSNGAFSVDLVRPLPVGKYITEAPAYEFGLAAIQLPALDGIGKKSDPFFEFHSQGKLLYRSDIVKQDLNPKWAPVAFNTVELAGLDTPFTIQVFDWDQDGEHDSIGEIRTTLRQIIVTNGPYDVGISGRNGAVRFSWLRPLPTMVEPSAPFRPTAPAYSFQPSALALTSRVSDASGNSSLNILPPDAFFEISVKSGAKNIVLFRSKISQKTSTPSWDEVVVNTEEVGGINGSFTISVFDYNKDGNHGFIGSVLVPLNTVIYGWWCGSLMNKKFANSSTYKNSGGFCIDHAFPLDGPRVRPLFVGYQIQAFSAKLPRKDLTSKSDPFFKIVYTPKNIAAIQSSQVSTKRLTVYRSEIVKDCEKPIWNEFSLNAADFEGVDNEFDVEIYDYDKDGGHDYLGKVVTTLRNLSFDWFSGTVMKDGKPNGSWETKVICALPSPQYPVIHPAYNIEVAGYKLKAKDGGPLVGTSDPFFTVRITKKGASNSILLYRSEVITKNLNPKWKPFYLSLREVGGIDSIITFSVFDFDKDGGHDLIGQVSTSFREFLFGPFSFSLRISDASGSQGGFVVEKIDPTPELPPMTIAPAYKVKCFGAKLEKMDGALGIGSSDPFFKIITIPRSGPSCLVYRSEHIDKSCDPTWAEFTINFSDLKHIDAPISVQVFDFDADGGHDLIGELVTTFREWLFGEFRQGLYREGKTGSRGAWGISSCEPTTPSTNPLLTAPALLVHTRGNKFNARAIGKSDPFFEITAHVKSKPGSFGSGECLLYRSEWITNSKEPKWEPFTINVTEIVGGLDGRIEINAYDYDSDGGHNLIGNATTTLREWIFGTWYMPVKKSGVLQGDSNGAFIIDTVVPLNGSQVRQIFPAYNFVAEGIKLDAMDLGKKSDPFFEIVVKKNDKNITIYRSEYIYQELNPKWEKFALNVSHVGSVDTPFSVCVYDYDDDGDHDLIGQYTCTLRQWTYKWYSHKLTRSGKMGSAGSLMIKNPEGLPTPVITNSLLSAEAFIITPAGQKLEERDGLGKLSDPYFEIYGSPLPQSQKSYIIPSTTITTSTSINPTIAGTITGTITSTTITTISTSTPAASKNSKILLYRSKVVWKSLEPIWDDFVLNADDVGGFDTEFVIKVWDRDEDGNKDAIGKIKTTLREMTLKWFSGALHRKGRIGGKSSGAFMVKKIQPTTKQATLVAPAYTFTPRGAKLTKINILEGTSDPYFEVYVDDIYGNKTLYYKSEYISATLAPTWQPFVIGVTDVGGLDKEITVKVYDWDANAKDTLIGECKSTLRSWIWYEYTELRKNSANQGAFFIDAVIPNFEYNPVPPVAFKFNPNALSLAVRDIGGKSDPFFQITSKLSSGSSITLYRSEVIKQQLNVTWAPFNLSVNDIAAIAGKSFHVNLPGRIPTSVLDQTLTISVFDWDLDGDHEMIGKFKSSLRELTAATWFHSQLDGPGLGSQGTFCLESTTSLYQQPQLPPVSHVTPAVSVTVSAIKLKTRSIKNISAECNPFFKVMSEPLHSTTSRYYSTSPSLICLYRSEAIYKSDSPSWKPFSLNLRDIGGLDKPFTIEIFTENKDGYHQRIGVITTTLREWTFGPYQYPVKNPDDSISSGAFSIDSISPLPAEVVTTMPKFLRVKCSARNVENLDIGDKSDPFFEISKSGVIFYRSEVIQDNLDPTWKTFTLNTEALGGMDSIFEISVWDHDGDGVHDLVGTIETSVRELLFGPYKCGLVNPAKAGKGLYTTSGAFSWDEISPTENSDTTSVISYIGGLVLSCSAQKLERKDGLLDKSDPYFVITKSDGSLVYRSKFIKNTLSPEWEPFTIPLPPLDILANPGTLGNFGIFSGSLLSLDTPLTISVYDYDTDGGHDFIGKFSITLRECALSDYTWALINPKKKGIPLYKSSGGFNIKKAQFVPYADVKPLPFHALITPQAAKLEKKLLGEAVPFLEVFTRVKSQSASVKDRIMIYRSEITHKKDVPPPTDPSAPPLHATYEWQPFIVSVGDVSGNFDGIFEVQMAYFNESGLHEVIGIAEISFRELIYSPFSYPLVNPAKKGTIGYQSSGAFIIAKFEPVIDNPPKIYVGNSYAFKCKAKSLPSKDLIGKSDPFFEISKIFVPGSAPIIFYRSKFIKDDSNPNWEEFQVDHQFFRNIDEYYTISVYDRDSDGCHTLIGELTTTLRESLFGMSIVPLIDPKMRGRFGYTPSGSFIFEHVNPLQAPSPPLGTGLALKCSGNKVIGNLKALYFELWALPNTGRKYILYRSEYCRETRNPIWEPFNLFFYLTNGIFMNMEIRVFGLASVSKGKEISVGFCKLSVTEILAGTYLQRIYDPSQGSPTYKTSGGFEITVLNQIYEEPKLIPATAYKIRCHVEDPPLQGDFMEIPVTELKVKGHPYDLAGKGKAIIYQSKKCSETVWELVVPFEGCGLNGFYEPLTWYYNDGKFKASLYELTLGIKTFYLWKKPKDVGLLSRLHDGILVFDAVTPLRHFSSGLSVSIMPQRLDVPENSPVFVRAMNSLGQQIYQTEACPVAPLTSMQRPDTNFGELQRGFNLQQIPFQTFIVPYTFVGGLDQPITFEFCSDFGIPLGFFQASLRQLLLNFWSTSGEFFIINPDKKRRVFSYMNSGFVVIATMNFVPAPQGALPFDFDQLQPLLG